MKNSKLNLIILLILFCSALTKSYCQGAWDTGGNLLTGPGTLGGSTNFEILFQTDGINRMKLMQTQSNTINGWPGIAQDGYLGLSTEPNFFSGAGPFSMLHLNGLTPTPLIAGPPLSNSLTL